MKILIMWIMWTTPAGDNLSNAVILKNKDCGYYTSEYEPAGKMFVEKGWFTSYHIECTDFSPIELHQLNK